MKDIRRQTVGFNIIYESYKGSELDCGQAVYAWAEPLPGHHSCTEQTQVYSRWESAEGEATPTTFPHPCHPEDGFPISL